MRGASRNNHRAAGPYSSSIKFQQPPRAAFFSRGHTSMTDLHVTVKQHAIEIAKLTEVTQQNTRDISQVREDLRESERSIMARLDGVSEKLGGAATKDDLLRLSGHFDESLNGVLRDAINAVPQHAAVATAKRANVWLAVAAFGAVFAGFVGMAAFFVEHVK